MIAVLDEWAPRFWTLFSAVAGGVLGMAGALRAARMNINADKLARREEARHAAYLTFLNRLDDLDTLGTWNLMFGDYVAAGNKRSDKALDRAEAYHQRVEACRRAINAVNLYENRKAQMDAVKAAYSKLIPLFRLIESYAEKPDAFELKSFEDARKAFDAAHADLLRSLEGSLL